MFLAAKLMLALAKCDEGFLSYIVSEGARSQHATGEAIHNAFVSAKNSLYFFSVSCHLSFRSLGEGSVLWRVESVMPSDCAWRRKILCEGRFQKLRDVPQGFRGE